MELFITPNTWQVKYPVIYHLPSNIFIFLSQVYRVLIVYNFVPYRFRYLCKHRLVHKVSLFLCLMCLGICFATRVYLWLVSLDKKGKFLESFGINNMVYSLQFLEVLDGNKGGNWWNHRTWQWHETVNKNLIFDLEL